MSITTRHVVFDQHDGVAPLLIDVENVARHVLLLVLVHAAHRLVEKDHARLERQRPSEFDPLAQPVGKRAGLLLAEILQFQEVDQLLADFAIGDFLALRHAPIDRAAEHAGAHPDVTAEHEIVENGQPAEQRDVLEGPGNSHCRDLARLAARNVPAFEQNRPLSGL